MNIAKFISNINPCYLILNILLGIVAYIYLGKSQFRRYQKIITIIYIIISLLSFSCFNGIIQNIFELKYLSVKFYLLIIAITNLIMIYTINKNIETGYKITNYILFILMTIVFGSVVSIVLGNKFENLYIMDIKNAINLEIETKQIIISFSKLKEKFKIKTKESKNTYQEKTFISLEELLNYDKEEGFYIDGVECSIIFEDSNQENILKNYQILSNDINARLVNGYTLDENKMLRNICIKLQVANLSSIDIDNISLLNKISIDEYNLLRRVFGIY